MIMYVRELPTQERLEELFSYEEDKGFLIRKSNTAPNARKGMKAGYTNKLGYILVWVDGQQYLGHRLIWSMLHGSLSPIYQIDHIDGNPSNNKLDNLRCVTAQINRRNQKLMSTNSSGHTGVYLDNRNGRWIASLYVEKKHIHIGTYGTKQEAIEARKEAEKKYGFHENHGKLLIY